MPDFNNNTPRDFGRQRGVFVPLVWNGISFPQGVAPDLVGWNLYILDRVVPLINGGIHPGGPNIAGTWGGEVRPNTNNPSQESFHGYGQAIDINAPWNPNNSKHGGTGPYEVHPHAADILRAAGGLSGVEWSDPMHQECHLHTSEMSAWYAAHPGYGPSGRTSGHPAAPAAPAQHPAAGSFPLPNTYYFGPLSGPTESISGMAPSGSDAKYRPAIQRIQKALGIPADGLYGPNTIHSVATWQSRHGLTADGLTGPATWKALGL